MSLAITVTISGDKRILQKMRRLSSDLYNFTDAMDDIGKEGARYFSGPAWLSQGGVFGNKWKPLSATSLYMRGYGKTELSGSEANFVGFLLNKQGQSHGIRKQSAGASGTQPLTTGHPDGMQFSFDHVSDRNSVTIFNNKSYFKYHQSTAPRKRLPRRQMIGASNGFRTIVARIIKEDVQRKISHA